MRARSNSTSMESSPIRRWASASSRSAGSSERSRSPVLSPARARARQPSSCQTGTPSCRETASTAPQQAQHHLVLAGQAPALTRRERTSLSGLPCDGQHGRAALALAAHKPSRTGHRLSITFHAVCPPAPRNNTVSKETAGSSNRLPSAYSAAYEIVTLDDEKLKLA